MTESELISNSTDGKSWWKTLGPGFLVTAAFVGPGTVLTASKAGASFGFTLLWAIGFSVLATILLQEMTARLGVVTGAGLGEAIRGQFQKPSMRIVSIGLTIVAILIGNAAYQTGNLTGAAFGMSVFPNVAPSVWVVGIAVLAAGLLVSGRFKLIQNVLVGLVLMMSLTFLAAAIFSRPDIGQIVRSCFTPSLPDGSLVLVIALIGTTVVPYNLFLHASGAARNWSGGDVRQALKQARLDTVLAVGLGGIVTAAILTTAAMTFAESQTEIKKLSDIAEQLRPILGQSAEVFFLIGLFAAGLTSSITAPMAAGFATAGCLGWKMELSDWRVRTVMLAVIAIGAAFAVASGASPRQAILLAQLANGLILPFIGVVLMIVLNSPSMGRFRNGWRGNVVCGLILLVITGLGIRLLIGVWNKL